jgi:hypothetical protein
LVGGFRVLDHSEGGEPAIVDFSQTVVPNLGWHSLHHVEETILQSLSLLNALIVNVALIQHTRSIREALHLTTDLSLRPLTSKYFRVGKQSFVAIVTELHG